MLAARELLAEKLSQVGFEPLVDEDEIQLENGVVAVFYRDHVTIRGVPGRSSVRFRFHDPEFDTKAAGFMTTVAG